MLGKKWLSCRLVDDFLHICMPLLPVPPFPFYYTLAALDANRVASAVLCNDTHSIHFQVSSSESLHLLVSFLKLSEKNSVLKEQSKYCDLCEDWERNWSWTWIEARWRVTFFGIDMRVEFWQDKLCACLSAHFYCVMIVTKLFCISQEKGYLAWSTNASRH